MFRKIFGPETASSWAERLAENEGMDANDVGHIRLSCLLRALMASKPSDDMAQSIAAVLVAMPLDAARMVFSCTPNPSLSLRVLESYVVDSRLSALIRQCIQSSESTNGNVTEREVAGAVEPSAATFQPESVT